MSETKEAKGKLHFKGSRTKSTLIIVALLAVYVVSVHLNIRPIFTFLTALVSARATYELIHAVGGRSRVLFTVSSLFSAAHVAVVSYQIPVPKPAVILSFYMLVLLVLAVALNRTIKYIDAVMAFFGSVCVTYALSIFIRLNDLPRLNARFTHLEGLYLFWIAFICSWVTDVFAFLVGRKFGKHKMSPHISPKKSWEGAIGGVLITAVINVFVLLGYTLVATKVMGYAYFMMDSGIKYLYVFLISCALSVVSMFGDLSASVLKRNVGIKDYSNILPGHGGIMDRFDSCLFVLPVLWGIYSLIYG